MVSHQKAIFLLIPRSLLRGVFIHAPHRTFDRATADGKLHGQELGIRHATLVLDAIVPLRADRLAVAASTDALHGRNDLLHLALQQQAALLGTPTRACFCTPVLAQRCHLSQVLHRMIKVQEFMHLLCREPSCLHQERDPFPDPRGPIGNKEHLVRLGDLEAL